MSQRRLSCRSDGSMDKEIAMDSLEILPRQRHSVPVLRNLLAHMRPCQPDEQRIRSYDAVFSQIQGMGCVPPEVQHEMSQLRDVIEQDVESCNERLAVHSLRLVGLLLQLRTLADSEAREFLRFLPSLICTTGNERICAIGLWCLSKHNLNLHVVVPHINTLVAAILHGVDNVHRSTSVTRVALQALSRMTKQFPAEMRKLSVVWVPPLYSNLMSPEISEAVEHCLSVSRGSSFPLLPKLTEVVVTDIHERLAGEMKSLLQGSETESISAVRAWRWFVEGLKIQVAQDRCCANELLKIMELAFLSSFLRVKVASQIAWVSVIDTFLPEDFCSVERSDNSSKTLKLLMSPLISTMKWEEPPAVQRNCCCTWLYLLLRLGCRVNDSLVLETVVLPMLEAVFKIGPTKVDKIVWASCLGTFKSYVTRRSIDDNRPANTEQTLTALGFIRNRRIGEVSDNVLDGSHQQTISWSPWAPSRLGTSLGLLKLLWSHLLEAVSIRDPTCESYEEGGFVVLLDLWRPMVEGVKAEESVSVRPSEAHTAAVHSLLTFLFWASRNCTSPARLWPLVRVLCEDLQPVILTSSFYKLGLPLDQPSSLKAEEQTNGFSPEEDTVTPLVYILAVWLKISIRSEVYLAKDLLQEKVNFLVNVATSGFDVMGTFRQLTWMMSLSCPYATKAQECAVKNPGKGVLIPGDGGLLLNVWVVVVNAFRQYLDEKGSSFTSFELGSCDADFSVARDLLLLPIRYFVCNSAECLEHDSTKCDSSWTGGLVKASTCSEAQLMGVQKAWSTLYDFVSSSKPSSSNVFIGGLFGTVTKELKQAIPPGTIMNPQCLRFLGHLVVHAMECADVPNLPLLAISRNRRRLSIGGSTMRVQCFTGREDDDATHYREILILSRQILNHSYEKCMLETNQSTVIDSVERVFKALTRIAQQSTAQADALRLLKVFSGCFSQWLGVTADSGKVDRGGILMLEYLLDAVSQAWDVFLNCLQLCYPALAFDSALLEIQARSLSVALIHAREDIADPTVSFWKATYGSRSHQLKYPALLVQALRKLRLDDQRLSCWRAKGNENHHKRSSVLYCKHPLAKYMPQNALVHKQCPRLVDSSGLKTKTTVPDSHSFPEVLLSARKDGDYEMREVIPFRDLTNKESQWVGKTGQGDSGDVPSACDSGSLAVKKLFEGKNVADEVSGQRKVRFAAECKYDDSVDPTGIPLRSLASLDSIRLFSESDSTSNRFSAIRTEKPICRFLKSKQPLVSFKRAVSERSDPLVNLETIAGLYPETRFKDEHVGRASDEALKNVERDANSQIILKGVSGKDVSGSHGLTDLQPRIPASGNVRLAAKTRRHFAVVEGSCPAEEANSYPYTYTQTFQGKGNQLQEDPRRSEALPPTAHGSPSIEHCTLNKNLSVGVEDESTGRENPAQSPPFAYQSKTTRIFVNRLKTREIKSPERVSSPVERSLNRDVAVSSTALCSGDVVKLANTEDASVDHVSPSRPAIEESRITSDMSAVEKSENSCIKRSKLRRKPPVRNSFSKLMTLRSSGRLRGDKHWRIEAEIDKTHLGTCKRRKVDSRSTHSSRETQADEIPDSTSMRNKTRNLPTLTSSHGYDILDTFLDRGYNLEVDHGGFKIRNIWRLGLSPKVGKAVTEHNRSRKCQRPKRLEQSFSYR